MIFEQAAIKIEKIAEFQELQQAVEKAFSQDSIERFLKSLRRSKIRIRDFDAILVTKTLEAVTRWPGFNAQRLYGALTLSGPGTDA